VIYLRPLPVLSPASLPGGYRLAGGWCRFQACEIIERHDDGSISRNTVPADDARMRAPDVFDRLVAPRPMFAGLALDRPRLMGIVNVTPDSFSDGGRFLDPAAAVEHARQLAGGGADLLDVGGESTRPGAQAVAANEELARVLPVLDGLRGIGLPVSVDTRRAAVMREAAAAGAAIINDVSALAFDADSATTVAALGLSVVLMHSRGTPGTMSAETAYDSLVLDVFDELAAAVDRAVAVGIARDAIVVDPGIGFAKTAPQSAAIMAELSLLHGLGCPLLVGASRKSFVAALSAGEPAAERLPGSIAALLQAVAHGAQILRVHDVASSAQALAVWRAVNGLAH